MKIIISQPRYLPAINYIARLKHAELFILLDNVQRQTRGWENRNKILDLLGSQKWLTIPSNSSSREKIFKTKINGIEWIKKHKKIIINNYSKYPFFDNNLIEMYYDGFEEELLKTDYNFTYLIKKSLENIGKIFDFSLNIEIISELQDITIEKANGPIKLLEICRYFNADTYISGPNGIKYGINNIFKESNIGVLYNNFKHPIYTQKNNTNNFIPYLAFFDILFSIGLDNTKKELKKELELISYN